MTEIFGSSSSSITTSEVRVCLVGDDVLGSHTSIPIASRYCRRIVLSKIKSPIIFGRVSSVNWHEPNGLHIEPKHLLFEGVGVDLGYVIYLLR
jgi:hypothetical protein